MADVFSPHSDPHEKSNSDTEAGAPETTISETELRALDDAQLTAFVTAQPDRSIFRIVSSLEDSTLQVRVVLLIEDESALKRVSRSSLDKKVRRAADKKLRQGNASELEQQLQKLAPLNDRMRAFIDVPNWAEADELLTLVSDTDLDEDSSELPVLKDFLDLRGRLKRQIDAHESTQDEIEEIIQTLDPSGPDPRFVSKAESQKLEQRWRELVDKDSVPEDSPLRERFVEALAARKAYRPPAPVPHVPAEPVEAPAVEEVEDEATRAAKLKAKEEEAARRKQLEASQRQSRASSLEKLLKRTRDIQQNLAHRHAASALREIQREASRLSRWRRDFPEKLGELETSLKTLNARRTEVLEEAKWDAWARTDRAKRIQAALEELLTNLDAEQDAEAAVKNASGLGAKLQEFANEMRGLGGLERDKDSDIWKKFRSLSDRGWAMCDKLRLGLFEKAKSMYSEHAAKPIEFTVKALNNSRQPVTFKGPGFDPEVQARIKALRQGWIEIGSKPSGANRETEEMFSRLYESYSRQFNIREEQKQRNEGRALEDRREIVNGMKISAEGKSTLLSRARVAKDLEARWKKLPTRTPVPEEMQKEFEGYQATVNAHLTAEVEKSLEAVTGVETRLKEVLASVLGRTGGSPAQVLKSVAAIEAELQTAVKGFDQLKGLRQELPDSGESPEKTFQDQRAKVLALLQECKTAANKETTDRGVERNRALQEAEELALSKDWETARARFEELSALWKKVGAIGQKQDPLYGRMFDNAVAFFKSRHASKDKPLDDAQKAKQLKTRANVLYALEALMRVRGSAANAGAAPGPLPFSDEELRTSASSRLLEFGMKYGKIHSMDPASGIAKEATALMEQWSKVGAPDDEALPAWWAAYLARVRALLGLSQTG